MNRAELLRAIWVAANENARAPFLLRRIGWRSAGTEALRQLVDRELFADL